MSSHSQVSKPMWDWPPWMKGSLPNPLDVVAAPQNLVQPILPGWVLGSVTNITEQNSTAPDTEREILASHSYGRQLGRVIDALAVVIDHLPIGDQAAVKEFTKLRSEINEIKQKATTRRLNRIVADLATLRDTKPEEFEQIAASLRDVLKESTLPPTR